MIDADIGDLEISVMCDIARGSGLDLEADKKKAVDRLIANGFVEVQNAPRPAGDRILAITRKGQRFLDDRGVGVNES